MQHAVDEAPQTGQREEMFPLLKRHEIQVLRAAGHSQAEVARICEVSERAVRRIEEELPVTHVDDAAERRRRGLGRPSKAEEWRAFVDEQLKTEPDLMTLESRWCSNLWWSRTSTKTRMGIVLASPRTTRSVRLGADAGVPTGSLTSISKPSLGRWTMTSS